MHYSVKFEIFDSVSTPKAIRKPLDVRISIKRVTGELYVARYKEQGDKHRRLLPGNCAIGMCSNVNLYCLLKVTDAGEICVTKRLVICTSHQITFELFKSWMRRTGRAAIMEENKVHMLFWWGNLRERDNWKELGVVAKIILKWNFMK